VTNTTERFFCGIREQLLVKKDPVAQAMGRIFATKIDGECYASPPICSFTFTGLFRFPMSTRVLFGYIVEITRSNDI
jgi:hypothetical protein